MKPAPSIQPPESCEHCQQQISESADTGEALSSEIQTHLEHCDACAQFAGQWFAGPPAILTRPVPAVPDAALRERIRRGMSPSNVIRFPTGAGDCLFRFASLGKIAACLALAGFSYWLLSPTVSRVPDHAAKTAGPTLTQGLLQMEDGTQREQRVLQAALVDSGRQVRGDVAWSMSALEL